MTENAKIEFFVQIDAPELKNTKIRIILTQESF